MRDAIKTSSLLKIISEAAPRGSLTCFLVPFIIILVYQLKSSPAGRWRKAETFEVIGNYYPQSFLCNGMEQLFLTSTSQPEAVPGMTNRIWKVPIKVLEQHRLAEARLQGRLGCPGPHGKAISALQGSHSGFELEVCVN